MSPDDERAMRKRVVGVAKKLFAQNGVPAVSMRNVAIEVGCSPMALYRYFGSRNEILRHIWEDFFVELFARLQPLIGSRRSARDKLRVLCAGYLDYWFEHPERFRIVFLNEDQIGGGERFYVEASQIIDRYQPWRALIAAAQQVGQARPGDPQLLAEALICAMHGIALNLITISEYPWRQRRALLDTALAQVLLPPTKPASAAARRKAR